MLGVLVLVSMRVCLGRARIERHRPRGGGGGRRGRRGGCGTSSGGRGGRGHGKRRGEKETGRR